MRILLSAPGAEDPRSPAWGHVRRSLQSMGHEVHGFDPVVAATWALRKEVDDQRRWLLDERLPQLVLIIPSGTGSDERLVAEAAERQVETHVLAVREIAEWAPSSGLGVLEVPAGVASWAPSRDVIGPADDSQPQIVMLGDVDARRLEAVRQLIRMGGSLQILGDGWEGAELGVRSLAHGSMPYSELAVALRSFQVAVVLAGDAVAIRGAPSGRPVHAALDAASAGLAVVAQRGTGVEEYLSDGVEALVIDDVVEIGPVATRLLSDATERHQLASAALDRVRRSHQWADRWPTIVPSLAAPTADRVHEVAPRVSAVVASYNIERFIGPAIDSVLGQSYTDIELLVVDDGSSDTTRSVVDRYRSDPRVRVLFHGGNVGQTGRLDFVLNTVIQEARGLYVATLGGDDIAEPSRFVRQVAVLDEEPHVDVVHTGGVIIDDDGTLHSKTFQVESYDASSVLRRMLQSNIVASPTTLMRRDLIDRVGLWSGGFACDYDYWIKVARIGTFRFLPDPLTRYRHHIGSSSTGAAVGTAVDQGLMMSRRERARTGLLDLFPALEGVSVESPAPWAAAYVDMGNGYLRQWLAHAEALGEYERALALPGIDVVPQLRSIILRNMAIAHLVGGDEAAARRLAGGVEPALQLGAAPDLVGILQQLVPPQSISRVPFELPLPLARETIAWDGTPASRTRILVVVDWAEIWRAWPVVSAYFETFRPDDDVDLVLPSLGVPTSDVFAALGGALAAESVDLERSAALTLEEWTELELVPMGRFAFAIDARGPGTIDAIGVRQMFADLRQSVVPVPS